MREYTTGSPLAQWELNIPSISVVVASSIGWQSNRCTGLTWGAYGGVISGEIVEAEKLSHGVFLNLPSGDSNRLFEVRDFSFGNFSDIAFPTTARAASSNLWNVSCTTLNGGSGEGFIALGPDGTTIEFKKLIYRQVTPLATAFKPMPRKKAMVLATKITDQWGNKVVYNYNSNDELTSIVGYNPSNGIERTINLSYQSGGLLDYATANGKTWDYQYVSGKLDKVVLPDGRFWQYDLIGGVTIDDHNNMCAAESNQRATCNGHLNNNSPKWFDSDLQF